METRTISISKQRGGDAMATRFISIIGQKGGTGKTTVAHMLGHGLGNLNIKSVVTLTDVQRTLLSNEGRRYAVADTRITEKNPHALENFVNQMADRTDGWIVIIDGGGNRLEFDRILNEATDISLLPFRKSAEDLRTVLLDAQRYANAFLQPTHWPTNVVSESTADKKMEGMLSDVMDRVLPPIDFIQGLDVLLEDRLINEAGKAIPIATRINAACRALATEVLFRMDPDLDWHIEGSEYQKILKVKGGK